MSKKDLISFSLFFISILFLYSLGFAQQEQITITTYYPSPYGTYREMRAQRIAIGENYVQGGTYEWDEYLGDPFHNIDYNADLVVEGNVGIGTTSPQYALDVGVGSTTWSNWKAWSPAVAANALTGPAAQKFNSRASGYSVVAARNPGASFSILMIPWDGSTTLENNCNSQINAGWHAQAAIKGNYFYQAFDNSDFTSYSTVITDQGTFDSYKSVGTQWWVACSASFGAFGQSAVSGTGTTNYLTKYTGTNTIGNSAVFESGGNVGIGTTGPMSWAKLDVVGGDVSFRGSGTVINGVPVSCLTSEAGGYGLLLKARGGSYPDFFVSTSGNVGIGTTNPGSYKLYVAGPAYKTDGSPDWAYSSDRKLKKNIKTITSALEKISKLRGVTFEWKEPQKHGNRTGMQMSMIAQDVEKVFPKWVKEDSEGYKVLETVGLDALVIEGIKELKKKNDALEAKNAQLEARIKRLEAKLR